MSNFLPSDRVNWDLNNRIARLQNAQNNSVFQARLATANDRLKKMSDIRYRLDNAPKYNPNMGNIWDNSLAILANLGMKPINSTISSAKLFGSLPGAINNIFGGEGNFIDKANGAFVSAIDQGQSILNNSLNKYFNKENDPVGFYNKNSKQDTDNANYIPPAIGAAFINNLWNSFNKYVLTSPILPESVLQDSINGMKGTNNYLASGLKGAPEEAGNLYDLSYAAGTGLEKFLEMQLLGKISTPFGSKAKSIWNNYISPKIEGQVRPSLRNFLGETVEHSANSIPLYPLYNNVFLPGEASLNPNKMLKQQELFKLKEFQELVADFRGLSPKLLNDIQNTQNQLNNLGETINNLTPDYYRKALKEDFVWGDLDSALFILSHPKITTAAKNTAKLPLKLIKK